MGFQLLLIAMVSIGASILCTYCYRHKLIKDRLFFLIMIHLGSVCVYGGMVVLGVIQCFAPNVVVRRFRRSARFSRCQSDYQNYQERKAKHVESAIASQLAQ